MRGSRPGERRGGRQKGTPNKKTASARAVMVALSAGPKVTPMDLMLAVMRDPHVALDMRVKMALKALPRLHRKLRAGESPSLVGDQSLPIENLSADARRVSMGASVSETAGIKSEKPSTGASASGAFADALMPEHEGAIGTGLMPLPFLLAVLNDAKTPAAIKLKVASATMPYTHPRQSTRAPKPSVATDRFGFTVEPALARRLRNEIARFSVLNKRRNPHPRDRATIQKLNEKIDAKFATLQSPCPSGYSAQQAATDKEKIAYLWRKRRSRRKLAPDEDAALAHVNARYCAFVSGPEARARARLRVLKDTARIQRQANGRPLNPGEKCELHFLTILYPPEIPALHADHEAFLERTSIFSECPFDSDGFPIDPVCPAPERAPTSEAAAGHLAAHEQITLARALINEPDNQRLADRSLSNRSGHGPSAKTG
jgi:hypothetical protein